MSAQRLGLVSGDTRDATLGDGRVPLNRPYVPESASEHIELALQSGYLCGGGAYAQRCEAHLEARLRVPRVLLTTSCTASLEMMALLGDIGPGDEIIMPSFTFPSTATAFVLRGATPVFVDVDPLTFNTRPDIVAAAITPATRALCMVHYGGGSGDVAAHRALADDRGILLFEDSAQSFGATFEERPLGTFGQIGAFSFHHTKNVSCGEGGCLIVNDPSLAERAEIILEKGTNRHAFTRGEVGAYGWVDVGSSYVPSEVTAALLWSQLEVADQLTEARRAIWARYDAALAPLEERGGLRRTKVHAGVRHNGHIYAVVLSSSGLRDALRDALAEAGIQTAQHYTPLHTSPAGRRFGRTAGSLVETERLGGCLLRLPVWPGLPEAVIERVADVAGRVLRTSTQRRRRVDRRRALAAVPLG